MIFSKTKEPPEGFVPLDALPEDMLKAVPTNHLIGPKRSVIDRLTGNWQKVDRAHYGTVLGLPTWSFDYTRRWTSGIEDDTSKTDRYSVVAVDRGVRVPYLGVHERALSSRMLGKFANKGFEVGDPTFDKEFTVAANDPETAMQVLNVQVRGQLLAAGRGRNWDFGGPWLVLWMRRFQEQEEMLAACEGIVRFLPPDLVDRNG